MNYLNIFGICFSLLLLVNTFDGKAQKLDYSGLDIEYSNKYYKHSPIFTPPYKVNKGYTTASLQKEAISICREFITANNTNDSVAVRRLCAWSYFGMYMSYEIIYTKEMKFVEFGQFMPSDDDSPYTDNIYTVTFVTEFTNTENSADINMYYVFYLNHYDADNIKGLKVVDVEGSTLPYFRLYLTVNN